MTSSDNAGNPASANDAGRLPGAKYFLPSEDEWYKAAYYDPRSEANSGPRGDDNYWLFPTQSDDTPTLATADATGNINNDTANIMNVDGASWNGQSDNVTTVGSGGPGSASHYGAFDMGGNAQELIESIVSGTERARRGGAYRLGYSDAWSSRRKSGEPATQSVGITGFRVASPSP